MNRYMLRFEKRDAIRYISHLDLARLFRRTFKRSGIELEHTKGFNPHPKMSFAQPLSLGYISQGEYLEFESKIAHTEDILVGLLNSQLPYGVRVLKCWPIPSENKKSIASLVRSALYRISFHGEGEFPRAEQIEKFIQEDVILAEKYSNKKKEYKTVDIKPMIEKIELLKGDEDYEMAVKIHTGSQGNLNPDFLLETLFEYCGLPFQKGDLKIERMDLYREDGKSFSQLF